MFHFVFFQFIIGVIGIMGPCISIATVLELEPVISYKSSRLKEDLENKATLNGPSIGGKIGWPIGPHLSLGFDGNYSYLEPELPYPSDLIDAATEQQYGLFLTLNFKFFKASSSYFFINQLKFTDRELRGDAIKIGLGIPIVDTLWASFDFIRPHFSQALGVSPGLPHNVETIMLSLSYLWNP